MAIRGQCFKMIALLYSKNVRKVVMVEFFLL